MGGIGKTTRAIEYAHRHYEEFDIAWWVPAEDPALIPERLAELALALELTGSPTRPGSGWRGWWASWPGGGAGWWCLATPGIPAPWARFLPRGPARGWAPRRI